MSLRAFRGGNPHERLVAISDPNLLGACRPTLCMIKDVHINNPKPLLRGLEFRAAVAHSRRASEITDILKAVVAGNALRIAVTREVGDNVLYHS